MRDKNSVHLHFHLHFCTDNWTGILFWFSRFSSINALTNCSGIVGLPLIIICSFVFWNFSSFSVYFRWHSCDLAFVCCLIFCICYGLCYLAYILFSICLAIAFNLYSCLVFHSCGIQVKAWEELNERGVDKTWCRPYGLGHGVGHGLPCGLLYGLPVVRFLKPEHNISKTGTDRLA